MYLERLFGTTRTSCETTAVAEETGRAELGGTPGRDGVLADGVSVQSDRTRFSSSKLGEQCHQTSSRCCPRPKLVQQPSVACAQVPTHPSTTSCSLENQLLRFSA